MNNKMFLTVHGAIYTVFAIALFVVPSIMWPMYGLEINDQYAYFLSQHTSIFLGGIGAISLLLRDIEVGKLARNLFLALTILNLLGVAITLYAGIIGIFTGFGWSDPAFFSLLSLFSYLQFKKQ
ncbi:hypothetical protein FCV43_00285 [Vibrio genomosp. F6]|uniref:hypothetical protein n=1 Tax=Vibrio TaxID=662 RepID=UPI000DEB977F|nr:MULTISPECIES: hypothetical protein [Vibrio]MDN3698022.1 hypothetical protein [Vibrio cortegadensis]NOH84212.1 hypothetical protein [Vibrio sp. 03-59-1]RBW65466.1 hypothetical protein DS893_10295 [Vibrionales bacterium C3R12]TKF24569.1 hypothetical protein FCV43_00285 [Vibrio genomosp. F6]